MPKISEEKKEARKQKIVSAAMECFSSKGYSRTSMDDIVEASGVSKGGIYLYYKSKDEIFRELADEVLASRQSIIKDFNDEMSYSERLKEFILKIVSNYNKPAYRKRIRFSFEFWVENKDKKNIGDVSKKKYLNKRLQISYDDLNTIIAGGIKAGEFRKGIDTNTFLYILFAAIDGLAFYTGVLDKPNPKAVPEILSDILNNYLLK